MNDNLPNDPNLNQDPTPVTPAFSPSPEVPAVSSPEVASAPEQVETLSPEIGAEKQPSSEIVAPTPAVHADVPQETVEAPVAVAETPPENVVDKRGHDTGEHKLKTSHKVTAEADEEEEDFIQHVEEVHSIA